MAGAPWPLDMGAPAFGAAMALAAGSYSAGLSAAGGFDVPSGLNPVTQLHAREMVLPADLSDQVRALAGAGDGGGQRKIVIQAVDSQSIERLMRNPAHARALFAAVAKHAGRNFSPGFR